MVHIFYSGSVQGVGFRYTTEDLALNFKICGWVRNLPGGGVEILAEAEKEGLDDFIQALEKTMANYIHHREITWLEAKNEFKDFQIKF